MSPLSNRSDYAAWRSRAPTKNFSFFFSFKRGDHVESRCLSRDAGNVISPRVSGEWEGGGMVLRLHIASICTREKIEATFTRYRSNFHTNCTKI